MQTLIRGRHWTGNILLALLLAGFFAACGGDGGPAPSAEEGQLDVATPQSDPGKSWAGSDPSPQFPTGLPWFNVSRPLALEDLKGKVVILDFWTLGCINCQHIIPDLEQLEEEFGDALAVIGVHSGKYATEQDDASILEAVRRFGLRHPVVNDADFKFWSTFGARAWPTLVIIDPAGNLVGYHAGEGVYALFQPIVSSLVAEFDARGEIDRAPLPLNVGAEVSSQLLSYPGKVLADEDSARLYIADSGHNRILVASLDGVLERVIGDGTEGFADGAANEARFRQPQGIALSQDGATLFVADTRNHAIRSVDLVSGLVTTIAGTGRQLDRLPGLDAKAAETSLASPWDLVVDGSHLFIAMAGVHQLWRMDLSTGLIEPFAGTSREGIDDGERRTMATLAQPSGMTTDGTHLYWVDPESSAVRRVLLDGSGPVETLAGTGLFDFGDVDGSREDALLQHPQGVAFSGGLLYVSDTYNHKIKSVDPQAGGAETAAGSERGLADGSLVESAFDEPSGLSAADGRLFVADTNNHAVRVIDLAAGEVRTLALTNLGVLSRSSGSGAAIELAARTAAPGVSTLRVAISTPSGYHLNSLAPGKLTLSTSDEAVVLLSETEFGWETDDGSVQFPVPVELWPGSATVTGRLQAYYCRDGQEALCFIQQVDLVLPVEVSTESTAGELLLEYALPAETP